MVYSETVSATTIHANRTERAVIVDHNNAEKNGESAGDGIRQNNAYKDKEFWTEQSQSKEYLI